MYIHQVKTFTWNIEKPGFPVVRIPDYLQGRLRFLYNSADLHHFCTDWVASTFENELHLVSQTLFMSTCWYNMTQDVPARVTDSDQKSASGIELKLGFWCPCKVMSTSIPVILRFLEYCVNIWSRFLIILFRVCRCVSLTRVSKTKNILINNVLMVLKWKQKSVIGDAEDTFYWSFDRNSYGDSVGVEMTDLIDVEESNTQQDHHRHQTRTVLILDVSKCSI